MHQVAELETLEGVSAGLGEKTVFCKIQRRGPLHAASGQETDLERRAHIAAASSSAQTMGLASARSFPAMS